MSESAPPSGIPAERRTPITRTATSPSNRPLADIRSFNRFELKFVIPELAAKRLQADLRPWVQPGSRSPDGGYRLESLYYDTADLRFYWEKIDGIRFRRKLRIRRCVAESAAAPSDAVFLEVKQRLDRVTQKRRARMTLAAASALVDHGVRPAVEPGDEALIDEVAVLVIENDLRPTAVTGYTRSALVGGIHDPGLRITFDRDLYYRSADLTLASTNPEGSLVTPGWVVVELKTNDRLPGWLSDLLADHGLSVTRISKYVQAIERAGAAPRSIFHNDPGPARTTGHRLDDATDGAVPAAATSAGA